VFLLTQAQSFQGELPLYHAALSLQLYVGVEDGSKVFGAEDGSKVVGNGIGSEVDDVGCGIGSMDGA